MADVNVISDLYGLFEAARALGGLHRVAEKRQFALIREFLALPASTVGYAPIMRNNYERYCAEFYENLVSLLETTYTEINLYTHSHSWFLERFGQNLSPAGSPAALRDRADAFKHSKSVDPEAQEEQTFLRFPETTQAVIRARLKENSLEPTEANHPLFQSKEPPLVLLDIRNHIIRMWYRDTCTRIGVASALLDVPKRFRALGCRIFTHLECTGVINFGAIPMTSTAGFRASKSTTKKVAIIGAGMAGLVAARQLRAFGFQVRIFEARSRPGGRVHAEKKKFSVDVDMGAMVITGILQNPVAILAHQTDSPLHFLDSECPLFDTDGRWVPKETDVWAEREFNRILDDTGRYRDKEGASEAAGKMSLGEAFQMALEKRVRRRKARMKAENCKGDRSALQALRRSAARRFSSAYEDDDSEYLDIPVNGTKACRNGLDNDSVPTKHAWNTSDSLKAKKRLEKFERPRKRLKEVGGVLGVRPSVQTLRPYQNEQSKKRFQSMDEKVACRLLRWHIANLEYGCAADISKVSLLHWDQDDPYGFSGEHVLLKNGYDPLVAGLTGGLKDFLMFGSKVTAVDYSAEQGPVLVQVKDQFGHAKDYPFDFVVITVPLGVLKKRTIEFRPKLPAKKLAAIDRLGFGGLMKVAMEFSHQFWVEHDMFGALRETVEKRGEFYFFWNLTPCTRRPVLMTLVVEPCVQEMESLPDNEIVQRALHVLRRCYPEAPNPKAFSVSRWSKDEFSGGVYTNIPVGSSGADYDLIEAPIDKRVFFGGEHTTRQYPTTCASAIISGLREAYRIVEECDMTELFATLQRQCLHESGLSVL